MGTMGGNVANGSPIGDSAPVLIALDAQLVLRKGERTRRMPLADFYVDYMVNRLEPGEFVQAIEVPLAAFEPPLRAYKISKRFDSDISAVFAVCRVRARAATRCATRASCSAAWRRSSSARRAAERAVLGQPWNEATLERAVAALAPDFKPLTDLRASAAYRLTVARQPAAPLLARNAHARRAAAARGHACGPRAEAVQHEQAARSRLARCRAGARAVARRRACRIRTSPRTCTWPARRPTSTTCPSSPARCTPRSACRRWRTGA